MLQSVKCVGCNISYVEDRNMVLATMLPISMRDKYLTSCI